MVHLGVEILVIRRIAAKASAGGSGAPTGCRGRPVKPLGALVRPTRGIS